MPAQTNIGFCLIILLSVLSASKPVSADESLEEKYTRAESLFEGWKVDEAILVLEQIYRANPEHESSRNLLVRAYRFKGIDLYALDQYDDAVSVWHRAIKIDPKNTEINSFIGRVLMEQSLLRRYDSDFDTSAYLTAEPPAAKAVQPPKKAPVARQIPKPVPKVTAPPQTADNHPFVMTEFHSGLAFPVGGAAIEHTAGWQLGGGFYFLTGPGSLRVGPEGIYARLPRAESDAPTFAGRYVSVAGVGVSFLVTLLESPALKVRASVGTGIYETAMVRQSLLLSTEDFDKDTKLGHSFGIRLEKQLIGLDLIGSARYLNLRSSLSPNLLQFSIGISAGK